MVESQDKLGCCLSFIVGHLSGQRADDDQDKVMFVGLNGVQGSGKTTLVSAIAEKLRQPPHSFPTIVLSIDDLYLTHEEQTKLTSAHPTNPLIQHRGQPSTHDLPLALSLFSDLRNSKETRIPRYDKSAYSGQGDRTPEETWLVVNQAGQPSVKVVLFEGWCVGFRALSENDLEAKWNDAKTQRDSMNYRGRLGFTRLEDVKFINDALHAYDQLTDQLDLLIHLDAVDPLYVYPWRKQAEQGLRETKGAGMTDEQVVRFVDGYYPAYELFTDSLRNGALKCEGRQLRLVIRKDRTLERIVKL
ncbi:hypothetical protein ACLMJK_005062 [Lecanora helva]